MNDFEEFTRFCEEDPTSTSSTTNAVDVIEQYAKDSGSSLRDYILRHNGNIMRCQKNVGELRHQLITELYHKFIAVKDDARTKDEIISTLRKENTELKYRIVGLTNVH